MLTAVCGLDGPNKTQGSREAVSCLWFVDWSGHAPPCGALRKHRPQVHDTDQRHRDLRRQTTTEMRTQLQYHEMLLTSASSAVPLVPSSRTGAAPAAPVSVRGTERMRSTRGESFTAVATTMGKSR